jgi:hypothetical protein
MQTQNRNSCIFNELSQNTSFELILLVIHEEEDEEEKEY